MEREMTCRTTSQSSCIQWMSCPSQISLVKPTAHVNTKPVSKVTIPKAPITPNAETAFDSPPSLMLTAVQGAEHH